MAKNLLYLASASKSRQKLLEEARIPYRLLSHKSEENLVFNCVSLLDQVKAIAVDKIDKVIIPQSLNESKIAVLTADTMMKSKGRILGKPRDLEDAKNMLRWMRDAEIEVISVAVLAIFQKENGEWIVIDKNILEGFAKILFMVPEEMLDDYFRNLPDALAAAGAGIIEGYGAQFLKHIEGCYTTVIGLPMFQLMSILNEKKLR